MDKQEILKKHYDEAVENKPDDKWATFEECEKDGTTAICYAAMTTYATALTASLSAENERLRRLVERAHFRGYNEGIYSGKGKYNVVESFILFKTENNL